MSISKSVLIFCVTWFAIVSLHHLAVAPSLSQPIASSVVSQSSVQSPNSNLIIAQDSPTDSTRQLTPEEQEAAQKLAPIISVVSFIIYIFSSYCLMKIGEKREVPNAWLAWVPIAQIWVWLRAAGKPGWWLVLFFIPLVNLVVSLIVVFALPGQLGKSWAWGLTILIPVIGIFIYFGVLGLT